MKQLPIILGAIVIVVGVAVASYDYGRSRPGTRIGPEPQPTITSFDECATAGYPIAESYPAQCRTPGGQVFSQNIGNELEKIDLIRLDNPRPNQVIASPLVLTGEARGTWYFEASFPVALYDANGTLLVQHYAEAEAEWMTTEFVPFRSTLTFTPPATATGKLILQKDNPSGLAEYDDQLEIPVRFAP